MHSDSKNSLDIPLINPADNDVFPPELNERDTTLNLVRAVEESPFWSRARWANIDNLLERQLLTPFLNQAALDNKEDDSKACSERVWLSGRALPLHSTRTLSAVYSIRAGLKGIESITFSAMHTFFYVVLGFHFYRLTTRGEMNLSELWEAFTQVKENGLVNLVKGLASLPEIYIKLTLALPFIWGGLSALAALPQAKALSESDLQEKINESTPRYGDGFIGSELVQQLPLVSARSQVERLERLVRWDARLTSAQREAAFERVKKAALTGHKSLQRNAMQSLAKIAHSFHTDDLSRLTCHGYSTEEIKLLENLKIKSIQTLEKLTTQKTRHSTRTKEFTEQLKQLPRVLYSHYLLWWLGLARSSKAKIIFPLFKATKLALETILIINLIKTIESALNCPEQPGFSFGDGFAPWAGDYTVKCFEKRITLFRSLNPTESVSELVKELQDYYLEGLTDLDLSNKSLTFDEAKQIIQAVQSRGAVITDLNLSNNNLKSLSENAFENLPQLQDLEPSQTGLTTLSANIFNELTQLYSLDLSYNQLTSLPKDILKKLTNLYNLDLSYNQFNTLPTKNLSTSNPVILNLEGNNITSIPEYAFSKHINLGNLNLANNKITSLPKQAFCGAKINYLDLSKNKLHNLPAEIFDALPQLVILILNENHLNITQLPRIFSNLTHLSELHLGSNNLKAIPVQIFKNKDMLSALNLTDNQLENLPKDAFSALPNLDTLYLGFNKFQTPPIKALSNLSKLLRLDLSGSLFNTLSSHTFEAFPNLWELYLESNNFYTLPSQIFSGLTQLNTLSLAHNKLSTLPADLFLNTTRLNILFLQNNSFNTIPTQALSPIPSLRLVLDFNKLTTLPAGILKNLPNLTVLSLKNNQITDMALYNLTLSIPKTLDALVFQSKNITYQGLRVLAAILPCTPIYILEISGLPENSTALNLQLQANSLRKVCESQRCLGVWSTDSEQCHAPKPTSVRYDQSPALTMEPFFMTSGASQRAPLPMWLGLLTRPLALLTKLASSTVKTLPSLPAPNNARTVSHSPMVVHTTTPESPCFYPKTGNTNIVSTTGSRNPHALLPACQLPEWDFSQHFASSIVLGGLSALVEGPRELLKIKYPNNKTAEKVSAALLFMPLLTLAYLEGSCQSLIMNATVMSTFGLLKSAGASHQSAVAGMLSALIGTSLWKSAPRSSNEAVEGLLVLAAGMIANHLAKTAVKHATRYCFFKNDTNLTRAQCFPKKILK